MHNWNKLISNLPDAHLLQTYEWGQVKAKYGWEPAYLVWFSQSYKSIPPDQLDQVENSDVLAAALVLKRRIPVRGLAARMSVLYSPKGPLMDWSNEHLRERVLDDLQSFARQQGAIFMKLDPDVALGKGISDSDDESVDNGGQVVMSVLKRRGWRFSANQIQFRNTVMIDLTSSEDEMLVRMKQKTRYNIRLAGRKGVTVRAGAVDDLSMLYKMYAETSVRDGFAIRDEGYYHTVWKSFFEKGMAEPLIAEVNGEPVAALMLFWFAGRAYYIYGMSRDAHREKMPTYLLQWEAMRRAKAAGCSVYDLWGAPNIFDESDSMWGVFRFKQGLGGDVLRTLGAWDYTPNPLLYKLYSEFLPRVLDVMRARGKARTRQEIGA